MAVFTIKTPRGDEVDIEAADEATAIRGAQDWDHKDWATSEATRLGLKPDLALRVMHQESGGRADALSPKGARGPMQLMPATAKDLGVDPDDPYSNISGGLTYLKRQLDDFGGDEASALAAYNAGPGAVRKHGGVPPYPETVDYVSKIMGAPAPEMPMGGDRPAQAALPTSLTSLNTPRLTAASAKALAGRNDLKADDGLGFLKGVTAPVFNTAGHLERAVTGSAAGDVMARMGAGVREALPEGLVDFIDNPQGFFDAQAERGVRPGKFGEFLGNVAGTAWVPGGPLIQGAAGGALLSDKTDAAGVLKDAAIGGVAGRATAAGADALQIGARKLLSRAAPKIMDLPALATATKAAYKAVDDSGFTIPKGQVAGLVDDFVKTVQSSALSKSAKDDAASIIQYARTLAKGDLKLSELEKLRGDIYQALVKKGGDTGRIGAAFRAKIDSVIDGVDNGLVRTARDLNARLKKTDLVTRASQSADIRAEKDYGGDYGRKMKDRVFPLIDPANQNRNLRGATPAELAALKKVVTGTKGQNLASTVGGMLDPRRLGGKILSGITTTGGGVGALPTGGLSLLIPALQMGAGFGLTGLASNTARKNVKALLDLIAVGGSKQALEKVPTKASFAAEQLIARGLRPVAAASAAPALAAARAKDRPKR